MRRSPVPTVVVLLLALVAALAPVGVAAAHHPDRPGLAWRDLASGSTERFRGLDVVSRRVVWLAGSAGTVLRSTDGGRSFADVSPPGAEALLFRDVEAASADVASVLAIGTGTESQVWRTGDGGRTWRATFVNQDPAAFYDCMAFWDRRNGIVLGDPVDGRWQLLRTRDGGRTWRLLPQRSLPEAVEGEFAFAASGTCITVSGERDVWFAGGGGAARVYRSQDRGRSWETVATPVPPGEAAGIFSLAFRSERRGIVVGGDFTAPATAPGSAAWSRDGGRTWQPAEQTVAGYRSGSAWLPWARRAAVAVGPSGSDVTWDSGRRWASFDDGSLDSVECSADGACFGSGAEGRVARLTWQW